jgi:hypothetical protein
MRACACKIDEWPTNVYRWLTLLILTSFHSVSADAQVLQDGVPATYNLTSGTNKNPTFVVPAGQGELQFQIGDALIYENFSEPPLPISAGVELTAEISSEGVQYSGDLIGLENTLTINNPPSGTYTLLLASDQPNSYVASCQILATYYPPAPVITSQPQDMTVNMGANVTFSVTATGTGLSYQWQKNGGNISGQNASTLSLHDVQASDQATYDVIVSNSGGPTPSSDATLTVIIPPSITAQPANALSIQGGTATFTVTASGTAPLTYQWLRNGQTFSGDNISGTASSTLTITSVSTSDSASYSVKVSNAAGSITSDNATLTVGPFITAEPSSATVALGGTATFSVTATGTSPTYQWYFDSDPMGGQTLPTLTLNNVQAANAGNYWVVVSNPAWSQESTVVTLSVLSPPSVTSPASQAVSQGQNVTFSVQAGGESPLTYQWTFQSANGGPFVQVPSGTGPSLTLISVTTSNAGYYEVTVKNTLGSITSGTAQLTVSPQPKITVQPQSLDLPPFTNGTFTVAAVGATPLTYQWYLGTNAIPGATNVTLAVTNVAVTNSGSIYSVTISNQFGVITSQPAYLTVCSCLVGVGTLVWSNNIPTATPPLFGPDGTLYVGSGGNLYAVSPSGQIKWSVPSATPLAVAANGTIYSLSSAYSSASARSGSLLAIGQNGDQLWSYGSFDYTNITEVYGINDLGDGQYYPVTDTSQTTVTELALRSNGNLLCFGYTSTSFYNSYTGVGGNGTVLIGFELNASGQSTGLNIAGTCGVVATDDTVLYCPSVSSMSSSVLEAVNPNDSVYWTDNVNGALYSHYWCMTSQNQLIVPFYDSTIANGIVSYSFRACLKTNV